jgi:hypothetical protein
MVTSDGIRIDMRDIDSPIICFCSKGDNITPPQQALGWILDLYDSVDDIRASGQTIIYAVHESVGHLGIFVSGSVAKKEHHEFSSNIDFIDCMPPGLYEAVMVKKSDATENPDLVEGNYISRFERRTLDDIRAFGGNDAEEDRCFATVARLSEMTHGLYRTIAQPVVRTLVTDEIAEMSRRMHPLRLGYELLSDRNPFMRPLADAAEKVTENRRPVDPDNPYWQWQGVLSDWIVRTLDLYRDWRDSLCEQMFFGIYGQTWLQAILGMRASDTPVRQNPGKDMDHLRLVERELADLLAEMEEGGLEEAALRALVYIRLPEGVADERGFKALVEMRGELGDDSPVSAFKRNFRKQFNMLLLDEEQAVAAIPGMLENHRAEAPKVFEHVRRIVTAGGKLGAEAARRLEEMADVFSVPEVQAAKRAAPKAKAVSA